MGVITWTGSTGNGDFNDTGNWLGGVVPVAADSLVFDRGNYSLTANLAPAFALAGITITAGFQGNIGTTSAALTPTGNITFVRCSGRGAYYKIGSGGTVGTSVANRTQLNLQPGTQFVISSGTWHYIAGQGGELRVEAAAVLSTGTVALTRCRAMILANGTAIAQLDADDGTDITTYRNITTAQGSGPGVLRFQSTAVAGTLCTVRAGHTVSLANTTASTHVAIDCKPGGRVLVREASAVPTITTLTVGANTTIERYAGGLALVVTTEINNNYLGSGGGVGEA